MSISCIAHTKSHVHTWSETIQKKRFVWGDFHTSVIRTLSDTLTRRLYDALQSLLTFPHTRLGEKHPPPTLSTTHIHTRARSHGRCVCDGGCREPWRDSDEWISFAHVDNAELEPRGREGREQRRREWREEERRREWREEERGGIFYRDEETSTTFPFSAIQGQTRSCWHSLLSPEIAIETISLLIFIMRLRHSAVGCRNAVLVNLWRGTTHCWPLPQYEPWVWLALAVSASTTHRTITFIT